MIKFKRFYTVIYFQIFNQVSHSVYGKPTSVELVADGKNILVTNENRDQFVELYVDNILNKSIENQFDAFKKGFYQVSSLFEIVKNSML